MYLTVAHDTRWGEEGRGEEGWSEEGGGGDGRTSLPCNNRQNIPCLIWRLRHDDYRPGIVGYGQLLGSLCKASIVSLHPFRELISVSLSSPSHQNCGVVHWLVHDQYFCCGGVTLWLAWGIVGGSSSNSRHKRTWFCLLLFLPFSFLTVEHFFEFPRQIQRRFFMFYFRDGQSWINERSHDCLSASISGILALTVGRAFLR